MSKSYFNSSSFKPISAQCFISYRQDVKDALKNYKNFTGNICVGVSFLRKLGLQACNFIKKRLQHRCLPVKLTKFLRTPTLKNICERLFLYCNSSFMKSSASSSIISNITASNTTCFSSSLLFLSRSSHRKCF